MPDNLPAEAPKDSPGQMDLALARDFLETQKKDIELRATELALRREAQNQSHEYAIQSLTAMSADRDKSRGHAKGCAKQYLYFAAGIIFLILTFATIALFLNKDAVVMECLKSVAIFAGGAGAGAVFGYRKGRQDESGKSDSKDPDDT